MLAAAQRNSAASAFLIVSVRGSFIGRA
jgi:hypothetical protein